MAKFIDLDLMLDSVAKHMSGYSTVPKTAFEIHASENEHDISDIMVRTAEKFYTEYMDAHPDSTALDGLGISVLSGRHAQNTALKALGLDKQVKLAACAEQLKIVADKADKAGLRKQAADLRYVASKLA